MSKKNDPEFTRLVLDHASLDKKTGGVVFKGLYANLCVNVGWRGIVVLPYSHIVWLLTHNRWPKKGYHIDHIDNDPFNNKPENLQEITELGNQRKKRGRLVYRSYGTGKYGYGMTIILDKRDNRYYVARRLSRGHGNGDLKAIRKGLGGSNTLEGAELMVKRYIAEIKVRGLGYMPGPGNE